MERIKILHESKFKRMTEDEMAKINGGGVCISCKKRTKTVEIEVGGSGSGTCKSAENYNASGGGWISIDINF